MIEELKRLKQYREERAAFKEEYDRLLEKFNKEHQELLMNIQSAGDLMQQSEEIIRTMALDQYKQTGEKTLDNGVKIMVRKTLEYDQAAALNWAKDHGLALSLDKRAFEKIAKAQELEIVEYGEKAVAAIPQEIKIE